MRRFALPLLFLASCASAQEAGERVDIAHAPFTSVHSTLLDFEFDGTLVSDTDDRATLRTYIEAQMLFTMGPLNGDSSVGQLGQLQVPWVNATLIPVPPPPPPPPPPPDDAGATDAGADAAAPPVEPAPAPAPAPTPPPQYAVTYHAKLPVAWGGTEQPKSYSFTLPARLGWADQLAFATKYGSTCVDPSAGTIDPGSMFIFYRPKQPGCALAANDVATFTATVTDSGQNTQGKSPEYHRLWSDNALEVVAIFSHQFTTPTLGDEGVNAYYDFVWRVHEYLGDLQPNAALRSEPADLSPSGGSPKVRLSAQLRDGRTLAINVMLVGHQLADDGAGFDEWYDGLTPTADVVLYNGHAGLGSNIRTLMSKGAFVPDHYLIWFANGCDTFAYVDRTLVDRRAQLNPSDPGGTKYMDAISNVMAGYFGSLGSTSLTLLRALVDARNPLKPPKTYEQIFQGIAPSQVVVVTGEEDNMLEPLPPAPNPEGQIAEATGAPGTTGAPATTGTADLPQGGADDAPTEDSASPTAPEKRAGTGCSVGLVNGPRGASSGLGALALAAATMLALRRQRRRARRCGLRPPDAPH